MPRPAPRRSVSITTVVERVRTSARAGAGARATDGLERGLDHMTRRGLRGIWVRGRVPGVPALWAADHHSWWDPFVARVVLRDAAVPAALLMDPAQLARFGMVRRLGVVGGVRAAQQALRDGRTVVIFPEGELRTPGPLGPVRRGTAWLADRTGAPVVAAAVRVGARGHEAPEAYVDLDVVPAADLGAALGERLDALDRLLAGTDPREPPAGFRCVLRGRRSWDERLGSLGRRSA